MLKYSIKISNGDIRQEGIVWGEKYLSPDLSFVSGVTSQDYHLEKFKQISVSNSISHTPNTVLPKTVKLLSTRLEESPYLRNIISTMIMKSLTRTEIMLRWNIFLTERLSMHPMYPRKQAAISQKNA